jgi:hypothetical protein
MGTAETYAGARRPKRLSRKILSLLLRLGSAAHCRSPPPSPPRARAQATSSPPKGDVDVPAVRSALDGLGREAQMGEHGGG